MTVDSPALVTDMIMDGNLGQPFMSRYRITLDLSAGRLWLGEGRPERPAGGEGVGRQR